MKTATVIDYIVQRIADEGIEHCFGVPGRSEEHTSELQSRSDLVCRLLLEKKKKKKIKYIDKIMQTIVENYMRYYQSLMKHDVHGGISSEEDDLIQLQYAVVDRHTARSFST